MLAGKNIGTIVLGALAWAAISVLPAQAADMVTYSWTTTSLGYGPHVDQPSTATFQVALSAVQSGVISYSDITNINLSYPGLALDSFTPTSDGLDNAAFVDPTTGAFVFHDQDQGLGVVGYAGGLFSDTFLSITIDNPYDPFGNLTNGVHDQFNAVNGGASYAGWPNSGYWTASFPVASPSPEPSTWAMLTLGVGFAGLAIRRRQRPVSKVSAA